MATLSSAPELLGLVADRFRALAEPARLRILDALREGEKTVTQLVADTGFGQANVSKHLRLLHVAGFVVRRKDGLFVHYELADDRVLHLCDLVCDRMKTESRARRRLLAS